MAEWALIEQMSGQVTVVYVAEIVDAKGSRSEQREEVVLDKDLFGDIDPAKSTVQIAKTKVEVVLVKVEESMWPTLEAAPGARKLPVAAPPVAKIPPSDAPGEVLRPKPYASPRDWEKLGDEISKEVDAEKPEGKFL